MFWHPSFVFICYIRTLVYLILVYYLPYCTTHLHFYPTKTLDKVSLGADATKMHLRER